MSIKSDEGAWISKVRAEQILGIGRPALNKLIKENRFTTRDVPGSYLTIWRADVEAMASNCTINGTL